MSKKISPNKSEKKEVSSEKKCICGHPDHYHDSNTGVCYVNDDCECEKFILNWYSKH